MHPLLQSALFLEDIHNKRGWDQPPALYLFTVAPTNDRHEVREVQLASWLRGEVFDSVRFYRRAVGAAFHQEPAPAPGLAAAVVVHETWVAMDAHPERQRVRVVVAGEPSGAFTLVQRTALGNDLETRVSDRAGRGDMLAWEVSGLAATLSGEAMPALP
ncbi:hypothetical protein [Planomonospora sp. ID82291]|uniref:hypothetical protein n=1 Tax=Planomonospora sp. ID82291 TaxID=2738136 RepID=UPI0018C43DED|nr:hypothetical protein [Planomonospora sp. ID82291]MBG0818441.1 hypothetical protein [Planomonospora sp. ID82291]